MIALILLPIYGTIYIQGDLPPTPLPPEIQCAAADLPVACEVPKEVKIA